MKTIVAINSNNYASTGNIMLNIASEARKEGFTVYTFSKNSKKASSFTYDNHFYIGTWLDRVISERLAYITGLKNHFNIINTLLFINKLNKIKPDLVHIHSLIDSYININMFFKYIKKHNIPIVWTVHDVWNITGQCRSFDLVQCDKWKTGCGNCPLLHYYPSSLIFDQSHKLFEEKKKMFNDVQNITYVPPSNWLGNLIKESQFNTHPVKVIHNGIDLNVFHPIESTYREENNLNDKYIILGVSYGWSYEKGVDVFVELSRRLPNNYQIIMVGTNEETDKQLPDSIISIHKTYNKEELIKMYTAADVFVNPTRADNFPTVNIEALACGTSVLTFNTGGSPEAIDDTCGSVVEKNDIDNLEKEIIRICENKPYSKENCLVRAKQFNAEDKYKEYVNLYNKILN